ncbi:MAG: metallophosphoesterase [Deltaproteobacteria bacterium]|nr:metallophosphoesterase [Deltaproteobacteria bacterium]
MMIIVTDAHISKARGNHPAFFKMLAAIERTEHDLIFLGDIFDLWIALPPYEEDIHIKFIAWCLEQKNSRAIGFLEGNHEYYLASQRAQAFTWCSNEASWQDDAGTLFVHGDQINRKDRNYLIFKKLIKNSITKFILRNLLFGPKIAESIKKGSKKTNIKFRLQVPRDEIKFFADNRFAKGVDTIFVGHFHQEYCYRWHASKELHILPDWLSTQKVTLYQKNPKKVTTMHWKEIR